MTELQEAYKKMSDASGIQAGDMVKILRKASTNEMGWCNNWNPKMDNFIGKIGEVKYCARSSGVSVYFAEFDSRYTFPFFVLEVIRKAPEKIRVGDYVAEFHSDGKTVQFGCQIITFEQVKAVYKAMKKLQKSEEVPS